METFLKDCAARQAKDNELKRSVALQALSIVTSNMKKYDYSDKHLEKCVYVLDAYCEKYAPGKNKLNFRDMLNRLRNANRPYEPLFRNLSEQYRAKYGAPPIEIPDTDDASDATLPGSDPSTSSMMKPHDGQGGGDNTVLAEGNYTAAKTLIEFTDLISKLGVVKNVVVDVCELD